MNKKSVTPKADFLAYRPDIDGLRAFAVLVVIGYHYFPNWVSGGFVGVDVFFVISGFLIGGILLDAIREGRFSILDFYTRRIRRIVPALLMVMVATLAFGWFVLLPDDYRNLGKHTVGGTTFISNLLLWKEAGYFDVISEKKPLLHLWSLGVEEQFYIVFPIFLWALWCKKWRFVTFISALLLVSLAYNLTIYKKQEIFAFYMPMTRFWELLAGSVIAAIQRSQTHLFSNVFLKCDAGLIKILLESPTIKNDGRTLQNFLSVLGIILLTAAVFTTNMQHFPGSKALLPVLGGVCIIVAGVQSWGNRLLLAWRPMVFVGLISYPLYLWHWPLLSCARIIFGEMPGHTFRIVLFAIALLLATLTYLVIERPIRFGVRAKGIKAAILLFALLLTGAFGGIVYRAEGMPERNSVKDSVDVLEGLAEYDKVVFSNEEDGCREKYGFESHYFASIDCYYHDAGGEETIALMGDSHAQVAFPGMAKYNAASGINTLLLQRHVWDNPVLDTGLAQKMGSMPGDVKDNQEFANYAFNLVQNDKKIHKVFIIVRGSAYIGEIGVDKLRVGLQNSIDRLNSSGKKVFVIAENPELPVDIRDVLPIQPMRPARDFHLYKKDVLTVQRAYLDILKEIKGAKVIYTLDAFCPADECLLFNEQGKTLYYDDNHLSAQAGGEFLIERVLEPYLHGKM